MKKRIKKFILQLLGSRFLLIFNESLVLDRWLWISHRIKIKDIAVADIGCGNGWLSMNLARMGKNITVTGLGYSDRDLAKAKHRATVLNLSNVQFRVQDVRYLENCNDMIGKFDAVICFEVIEHILDDVKLFNNLVKLLRNGGKLYMTTPNEDYIPMGIHDKGPFHEIEDGGHVRKGYNYSDLTEMAIMAGLSIDEISYCSGWSSQQLTKLLWVVSQHTDYRVAWLLTLPLRILPPFLDSFIKRDYPKYSICLVATK